MPLISNDKIEGLNAVQHQKTNQTRTELNHLSNVSNHNEGDQS